VNNKYTPDEVDQILSDAPVIFEDSMRAFAKTWGEDEKPDLACLFMALVKSQSQQQVLEDTYDEMTEQYRDVMTELTKLREQIATLRDTNHVIHQ
jgi:hypothetical protein